MLVTMTSFRILASVLALTMLCAVARAAETVSFPGDDVTLKGILYRPPGAGPFPAVVALHGCSGLFGKDGSLSPRHAEWADRLTAAGFVVLFPDSFGSRGATSQCKTKDRVTRPSRERVADAIAAKTYLQTRKDVKADGVALLGWSNGGSTVLYAVEPRHKPKDRKPDFAKAVAFYPGCRVPNESDAWRTRMPLLILIGAADDWTPAAPCKELAADDYYVSIKVYPGAYHDFDHPNLPVRLHHGLAYTADGGDAAHTGTNPTARADALTRVPAFLTP